MERDESTLFPAAMDTVRSEFNHNYFKHSIHNSENDNLWSEKIKKKPLKYKLIKMNRRRETGRQLPEPMETE